VVKVGESHQREYQSLTWRAKAQKPRADNLSDVIKRGHGVSGNHAGFGERGGKILHKSGGKRSFQEISGQDSSLKDGESTGERKGARLPVELREGFLEKVGGGEGLD